MGGFVSFVSAGPGAADLLSLRAAVRLREAAIVFHDSLIAPETLALVPEGARLVPVGKRAGQASPRQAEVSAQLVAAAQSGQKVVRLKAGDAGLFGRLEEEITALRAAGIAYEIVPGITAASAAAAAAGLPLTRRGQVRRVQFFTAADESGGLAAGLSWAALADPGALSAVYMGRRLFPALAARLIAEGLPPETPALLAESLGLPGEHQARHTLATLAKVLAEAPETSAPTLILYGALLED